MAMPTDHSYGPLMSGKKIKFGHDIKNIHLVFYFRLQTSPGSASDKDFVSRTVDVTFQPGETGPKQVEFEIVDDPLVENTESFQVSMVSSSVAAVATGEPATVNIRDNDRKYFSITYHIVNMACLPIIAHSFECVQKIAHEL